MSNLSAAAPIEAEATLIATGAPAAAGYVFDNAAAAAAEQHRCLSEFLDPITLPRLSDAGVGPGWHCLEVGAGGGSVARWLAERVAPDGSVLATDLDPPAEAIAGPACVPGLRIVRHDIVRDPLPEGAFDLITARLVLRHLPERDRVLAKLLSALRPGGILQVDEFDTGYCPVLLAPDERSRSLYEAFLVAKEQMFAAAGAEPNWGRHAAEAMRAAGFCDIDPVPRVQAWAADSPGVRLLVHTARRLSGRLTQYGLTERELDEVCDLMRSPGFRATSCVVYSVQGRRPA